MSCCNNFRVLLCLLFIFNLEYFCNNGERYKQRICVHKVGEFDAGWSALLLSLTQKRRGNQVCYVSNQHSGLDNARFDDAFS